MATRSYKVLSKAVAAGANVADGNNSRFDFTRRPAVDLMGGKGSIRLARSVENMKMQVYGDISKFQASNYHRDEVRNGSVMLQPLVDDKDRV